MISKLELLKLAALAHLYIDESNLEKLSQDLNSLNSIFGYMEQLEKVDVSGVEPMSHVNAAQDTAPNQTQNVFREDKVLAMLGIEQVLRNAPDSSGRFFRVPLII